MPPAVGTGGWCCWALGWTQAKYCTDYYKCSQSISLLFNWVGIQFITQTKYLAHSKTSLLYKWLQCKLDTGFRLLCKSPTPLMNKESNNIWYLHTQYFWIAITNKTNQNQHIQLAKAVDKRFPSHHSATL